MLRRLDRVDGPAVDEVGGGHVVGHEEIARQGHARSEHRVAQILEARPPGGGGAAVEHQGHGDEAHHLEKHIERHKILGHG